MARDLNYFFNQINLNFELRVSVNKSFFTTKTDSNHEINQSEQSLSSQYASIFYENYFNKIDSFVVFSQGPTYRSRISCRES